MSPSPRLFDPIQYDASQTVPSYWETTRARALPASAIPLSSDETADVAIIGGGYCGLSAALHLARQGIAARVLEAGEIGWGASGRNGGFCSIGGSFLSALELKAQYGESDALALLRIFADAVRLVDRIATEENLDIGRQGDGVWTFAHKPNRLSELEAQRDALAAIGEDARIVSRDEFAATAFQCTEQHGALYERTGFGVNPLHLCLGLAAAAARHGAVLNPHSEVTSWAREGGLHRLSTASGSVRAKRVIVAANGYLPEDLIPELAGRVLPVLSNIVITRPLTDDELAAQHWRTASPASNTRAHLAYIRVLPDKRFLFGGRGDTTGSDAGARGMRKLLSRRLGRLFPAWRDVEITHSWRGFIAATRRLTPALGELESDPTISYAFGCHGNGVALMTWIGRELAARIAGKSRELPSPLRGLPPRFAAPSLRLWQLRAILLRGWVHDAF